MSASSSCFIESQSSLTRITIDRWTVKRTLEVVLDANLAKPRPSSYGLSANWKNSFFARAPSWKIHKRLVHLQHRIRNNFLTSSRLFEDGVISEASSTKTAEAFS
jgi:hypothetical protein